MDSLEKILHTNGIGITTIKSQDLAWLKSTGSLIATPITVEHNFDNLFKRDLTVGFVLAQTEVLQGMLDKLVSLPAIEVLAGKNNSHRRAER